MQIGANDGVQNDFMREWYNDDRVDAILIEPQDEAFARLSENYKTNPRVRLVNCAVTRDGRSLSLYRFENSNENSIGIDVLASFNKDHVKSWKTRLGLQSNIIQEEYAGKTIASITKMVGWPGVDVLVVDTEGYDFQILGSLQDIGCLPSVVMFEHINLDGATKLMAIDLMKSLQYGIHWGVQDALCIRFDIDDCKS